VAYHSDLNFLMNTPPNRYGLTNIYRSNNGANGQGGGNGDAAGGGNEAGDDANGNAAQQGTGGAASSTDGSTGGGDVVVSSTTNNDGTYDPYSAFNISECDTYSHLWTYDLFSTCANGQEYCECTYASELMYDGLLSCSEAVKCPGNCPICSNCMRAICGDLVPEGGVAVGVGNYGTIPAAAFFATIILAACCILARSLGRKGCSNDLEEGLMDTDSESSVGKKHWMVPVQGGLPSEKGDTMKPVWLAPITLPDDDQPDALPSSTPDTEGPPEIPKRPSSALLVLVPKGRTTTISASIEASRRRLRTRTTDVTTAKRMLAAAAASTECVSPGSFGTDTLFPDLLGDEENADKSTKPVQIGSQQQDEVKTASEQQQHHHQTLGPGLWMVPLSNESVASTISDSAEKDSVQDSLENKDDDQMSDENHGSHSGYGQQALHFDIDGHGTAEDGNELDDAGSAASEGTEDGGAISDVSNSDDEDEGENEGVGDEGEEEYSSAHSSLSGSEGTDVEDVFILDTTSMAEI
jgi:hypothetical protein